MKLLIDLKELYPAYFWAVFGSTAIYHFDNNYSIMGDKNKKFPDLNPKDIDVVTNAKICTRAFIKLVESLADVLEVKQANKGQYAIEVISKRIEVVTTEGTFDFVFVRELDSAKQWLDYQAYNATQVINEVMLDSTICGQRTTKEFREFFYEGKLKRLSYNNAPEPTEEHTKKIKNLAWTRKGIG